MKNHPIRIPNLIQAQAADICEILEQNWNQIVMKIGGIGPQQLILQWPLLDAGLFENPQNALAQLKDFFVLSMKWAGVPDVQLLEMWDFMAKHAVEHCAAAKLAVLGDFSAAYGGFRQLAVPHMTPAALSHYLHAISLNARHKESPQPYRQKIIRALWKCQAAKEEDPAALALQKQWRQHLIDWQLADSEGNVSNVWDLSAYLEYQSLLKTWGKALKCEPSQIQVWLALNTDILAGIPDVLSDIREEMLRFMMDALKI